MIRFLKNKYVVFASISALYILWVAWTGFWWLLIGILILFDIFITRLIPWCFWKLPSLRNTVAGKIFHWIFFIITSYIIIWFLTTFFFEPFRVQSPSMEQTLSNGDFILVSKIHYGPRIPAYPLSIPFLHNRLPFSSQKSYSGKFKLAYRRLKGFSSLQRGDVVVFNFPEGDTITIPFQGESYYSLRKKWEKDFVHSNYQLMHLPMEKRDYFIKRCIGLPGDLLAVKHGKVFVNNRKLDDFYLIKHKYYIKTADTLDLDSLFAQKFNLSLEEAGHYEQDKDVYELLLTSSHAIQLKHTKGITGFMAHENTNTRLYTSKIFPRDNDYPWTEDNYGPLYIPKKGHTVLLKKNNLPLYSRIIKVHENNTLGVREDTIFINGKATNQYTFKMNYYFMMGDNRHYSADSRYWGFVPENHVKGKAVFTWFSFKPNGALKNRIRWKKMFHKIK